MLLGSARPNQSSKALQVLAAGAGMLPFFLFRRRTEIASDSVPSYFTCPITMELYRDPVVLGATGHTFERTAIEKWFAARQPPTDPKTNQKVADTTLSPNWALREAINEWLTSQGRQALPPPAQHSNPTPPPRSDHFWWEALATTALAILAMGFGGLIGGLCMSLVGGAPMSTLASIVLLLRFIDLHRGRTNAGGHGAGGRGRGHFDQFLDRIFLRRGGAVPRGAGGRPRIRPGVGGMGGAAAAVVAAVREL